MNLKVFVADIAPGRSECRRRSMSYQPTPDQAYSLLELFLYIMGFFAVVLIFLYIASERPAEKPAKKEEKESE